MFYTVIISLNFYGKYLFAIKGENITIMIYFMCITMFLGFIYPSAISINIMHTNNAYNL